MDWGAYVQTPEVKIGKRWKVTVCHSDLALVEKPTIHNQEQSGPNQVAGTSCELW